MVQRSGTPQAPAVEHHRQRAADEPAVPDQPTPGEQGAGISGERDIPELGADDAADHGGGDHVGGVLLPEPALPQLRAISQPPIRKATISIRP